MVALYIGLVIYALVFPSVCAFALIRGRNVERQVAVAYLIAAAASMLASAFGTHGRGPNWNVIVVDGLFLIALVVIARRSTRFWPLWAAASQLAGFLAHVPIIIDPTVPKEIYVSTQPFWAFPLLASLLIGTISAHRLKFQTARDRVPGK
jgi:hypothetical protein